MNNPKPNQSLYCFPLSFIHQKTTLQQRAVIQVLQQSSSQKNCQLSEKHTGEDNYHYWKKDILFLDVQLKTRVCQWINIRPENITSEMFEAWRTVNGLILSWINHSVEKPIASTIMYTDYASVAWSDVKERYEIGNGPQIYQIRYEPHNLLQEMDFVAVYFYKLKAMWDALEDHTKRYACTCSSRKFNQEQDIPFFYEIKKIIQFFLGLSENFMSLRKQILSLPIHLVGIRCIHLSFKRRSKK